MHVIEIERGRERSFFRQEIEGEIICSFKRKSRERKRERERSLVRSRQREREKEKYNLP